MSVRSRDEIKELKPLQSLLH